MDPAPKRALNLLVDKQAVLFKRGVPRVPGDRADAEVDFSTLLDSSGSPQDLQRGERW